MRNKLCAHVDKLKFNMPRSISTIKSKTFWLSIKRYNLTFSQRENILLKYYQMKYNLDFSYFRMKNISLQYSSFYPWFQEYYAFKSLFFYTHTHWYMFLKLYKSDDISIEINRILDWSLKITIKKNYKHTIYELLHDAHLQGEEHSCKIFYKNITSS